MGTDKLCIWVASPLAFPPRSTIRFVERDSKKVRLRKTLIETDNNQLFRWTKKEVLEVTCGERFALGRSDQAQAGVAEVSESDGKSPSDMRAWRSSAEHDALILSAGRVSSSRPCGVGTLTP